MKTLISLFAITLFSSSCNTHSQESKPVSISDLNYMEISLENDEPWIANIETTQGVAKMLNLVQGFSRDYSVLQSNLEYEFQILFLKCSMTGEAHNQLHNYLIPMVALFEDIAKDDAEVSALAVEKLKLHLEGYSLFFE